MASKITLLMSEANIKRAKKIAAERGSSVSKIVEDYIESLDLIERRLKQETPSTFVKKFAGIVNTGKTESKKTILAGRHKK